MSWCAVTSLFSPRVTRSVPTAPAERHRAARLGSLADRRKRTRDEEHRNTVRNGSARERNGMVFRHAVAQGVGRAVITGTGMDIEMGAVAEGSASCLVRQSSSSSRWWWVDERHHSVAIAVNVLPINPIRTRVQHVNVPVATLDDVLTSYQRVKGSASRWRFRWASTPTTRNCLLRDNTLWTFDGSSGGTRSSSMNPPGNPPPTRASASGVTLLKGRPPSTNSNKPLRHVHEPVRVWRGTTRHFVRDGRSGCTHSERGPQRRTATRRSHCGEPSGLPRCGREPLRSVRTSSTATRLHTGTRAGSGRRRGRVRLGPAMK